MSDPAREPRTRGRGAPGSRIEAAFERWGHAVVRHCWLAIAVPVAVTVLFASWLPQLQIDNSTEAFLLPDDPATIRYESFRDRFDRDDRIIVALAPPEVFDPGFLEKLRRFHLALEDELPTVQKVTSLFNARSTRGEGDTLIVEDLLEGWLDEWPEDTSALSGLRARVLRNPLYVNTLVSEDSTLTTVTIEPFTYSALGGGDALAGFDDEADEADLAPEFLTAAENDALMAALHAVVARFESQDFPIHLGGPLAITDHINRSMTHDLQTYFGWCALMMMGLLYGLFRRASGVLLPFLVVFLSMITSVGAMIALGIPGSTAVQILPVFLLTVGVCDAVHILVIVYQRLELGDAKDDAIAYALGHSGLAVVMTSLTTAAGMASFITATMAPVRHLGVIAPLGILLALAYTLVLLPALLKVMPLRPPAAQKQRLAGALGRALVRIGVWSADHPRSVLFASALLLAFSAAGVIQVKFSHYALSWFEADDPIRVAAETVDRELRGSMSLEVVVDTTRVDGLHEPDVLRRIERAMTFAEGLESGPVFVGKAMSLVDIVKETHQALNADRPEARRIPEHRTLVAQELLLFENGGADDLQQFVDSEFREARISLRAPFVDAMLYGPFMDEVAAGLEGVLGPELRFELTGFMPVLAEVVSAVVVSMARSYVFALAIITPLMVLLLRNLKLGLVSMVPNLIPVVFVLGLMGWLDIPLDGTTIMIGAMVIGLAVDDTIHFMHKFRIYSDTAGDARSAVALTLATTGNALLFTSLVLAGGFLVISLATMQNTQNFGLLAAVACIVAFVADVVVAPALMALVDDRERSASSRTEGVDPKLSAA